MRNNFKNSIFLQKEDTVTGEVTVYPEIHNSVLDNFSVELQKPNGSYVTCKIGRGSASTTSSMTTLVDRIAIASPLVANLSSYLTDTTYQYQKQYIVYQHTLSFTYSAGSITDPIREIGFSLGLSSGDSNTIVSRVSLPEFRFPDIVVAPTETFTVTYVLNIYMSTKPQTFVLNLNKNNTLVPITVKYITAVTDTTPSVTDYSRYDNTSSNVVISDSPASPVNLVENSYSLTITDITPQTNAWLAYRILIPASQANWETGIRSIRLSNNAYLEFSPAIVKDSDSTVTLDVHLRSPLLNASALADAVATVNYSLPVIDIRINATTGLLENPGEVSFIAPDAHCFGIFAKRPGFLTTHKVSGNIPIQVNKSAGFLNNKWSWRAVVLITDSIGDHTLFTLQRPDVASTSVTSPGVSTTSSKNILDETVYLSSGNVEGPITGFYGKWVEIVAQCDDMNYKLYFNGTAVINTTLFSKSAIFLGAFNKISLGAAKNASSVKTSNGLIFNSLAFYDNYLITPQGLPPEVSRTLLDRTMFLETFVTWPTPQLASSKIGIAGTVVCDPVGGPGGIPCLNVSSGYVDFLNPNINFYSDEGFTLEFDVFLTASSATNNILVLDNSGANLGNYLFSVLDNYSANFIGIDQSSPGTTSGSVTIPSYNTWMNWVIVYRLESGTPKLYVARDGVVIMTKTFPTDSTAVLPVGLGRLLSGTLGNFKDVMPSNNYKIANIRLTRGVIEYFNTVSFTPPVGLKNMLT